MVQQNKVDRTLVKRALLALRKVTPNVIGAVLNAVDVKTKGYYGYSDYGARRDAKDKKNARSASSSRPSPAAPQPEATDVPLV